MVSIILQAVICLTAPVGPSVAMVLNSNGGVTLSRPGADAQPVAMMTLLYDGDEVSVPAEGDASLVFFKGNLRQRIKPGSKVIVAAAGAAPSEAVEQLQPVDGVQNSAWPKVRKLASSGKGGALALRGADTPEVSPLADLRVISARPNFSWPAVTGAVSYKVDVGLRPKEPLWTEVCQQNRLMYSERREPLVQSRTYYWDVTAQFQDGSTKNVAKSSFFVVSAKEAAELSQVERLEVSGDPADVLAAAAIYHTRGLYDKALPLYESLAKKKPSEPFLHAALADCYEFAGKPSQAKAARQTAVTLGWAPPEAAAP